MKLSNSRHQKTLKTSNVEFFLNEFLKFMILATCMTIFEKKLDFDTFGFFATFELKQISVTGAIRPKTPKEFVHLLYSV